MHVPANVGTRKSRWLWTLDKLYAGKLKFGKEAEGSPARVQFHNPDRSCDVSSDDL